MSLSGKFETYADHPTYEIKTCISFRQCGSQQSCPTLTVVQHLLAGKTAFAQNTHDAIAPFHTLKPALFATAKVRRQQKLTMICGISSGKPHHQCT